MKAFVFILTCLLALSASARTITVDDDLPADFNNIQAAIDDANDGDTVIIAPGTYTGPGNRDIDFLGKAITVRSTNPKDLGVVTATVIDCNGTEAEPHRGFKFTSGEGQESVLAGMTIINGYSPVEGGGAILCEGAGPVITRCIIRDNYGYHGGGIYCSSSIRPTISRCIIENNEAYLYGGGIGWTNVAHALINQCQIRNNDCDFGPGGVFCVGSTGTIAQSMITGNTGAGLNCSGDILITHCTVSGNSATWCGGISYWTEQSGTISHCLIWGNSSSYAPQELRVNVADEDSRLAVRHCNIAGGFEAVEINGRGELLWGDENIAIDPRYVDPSGGDYHLSAFSPCINAGDPSYIPAVGEVDFDGEPRVMGAAVDIGADEFTVSDGPFISLEPMAFSFHADQGGPNPQSQTVYIGNIGTGVLDWRVASDSSWLEITPSSGTATGETDQVTVSVDVAGLLRGSYAGQLTVTAEAADNSPVTIPVQLRVFQEGVLHVPSEFATIQQAIDFAEDGREVILAPGTYTGPGNRDIDFHGKAITVRSTDPTDPDVVAATIIDCQGTEDDEHRGFHFHSGEDLDSVLWGVTVINGYAYFGGGIECIDYSHPQIINCVITDNTADRGGGIYCYNYSNPTIENCIIAGNSAWAGGGIRSRDGGRPKIINCTILNNHADYEGGGIGAYRSDTVVVNNCILRGNTPEQTEDSAEVAVTYSNVEGGHQGTGNIDIDPAFIDPAGGDFHLSADSPCVDAGDPNSAPYQDKTDIDGDPRVFNGRIDMGVDELFYDGPLIAVWPPNMDFFAYEGGSDPPIQALSVYNRGSDGLEWRLTEDCDWLEVSRQAGSSWGEPSDVELTIDISGMLGGYYYCDLIITDSNAANSPRVIPVTLHVLGPVIDVSTPQIEVWAERGGENPKDQLLTVGNSGGGTLYWVIAGASDCNWLEVAPASGASGGEITDVALSFEIAELTSGVYTCVLEVSDPNSTNSPQTVTVALHVVDNLLHVPGQFPTIQDGIDHVLEGGTVIVADGIYIGEGNRDIDFKGKSITVRSENGPENCIVDCSGAQYEHFNGFVFLDGEDANSVLDGFTITNAEGHAIYCYRARATVRNCIMNDGGSSAIHLRESDLSVTNCIISNNRATGGGHAGGSTGGGIYLTQSRATITNCIITGNMAYGGAGGIHCYGSRPIITNCTICDNVGSGIWGVPYYGEPYHPIIANCILWGNSLEQMVVDPNYTIVAYSNIQDGWPGLGNISEDPCFVSPGYWDPNGTTHTRYDDFWVQGDYHLKSEGWRWDTQRGVWTWEDVTSRCIDAGNPASPLGDEPLSVPADPNNDWGVNVRINMGAYGGTGQASIPPNGWSVSKDYNNDGIVNFTDFACWSIYHGYILPEPPDNSSPSPTLNAADLALFADRWLDQTTWFTTPSPASSLPPNAASNPNPPDGSVAIRLDPVLSWQPGFSALSHDVYFGTSSPGTFQGNQTETTFRPDPLDYETLYHWRIDELNDDSKTTGTVWTFTTTSGKTRCFPADTGVWVDGVLVQISKVIPGQKVGKASNALASACLYEVESVQEHSESEGPGVCYDIVLESGNRISVVDCHYFLVDSGRCVAVQNLRSGSKLMSLNGPITVSRIVKRAVPFVGKCYNLKIKGSERYFIGKDAVIVRDW